MEETLDLIYKDPKYPSSKVVRALILRIEIESSPESKLSPKMSVSK